MAFAGTTKRSLGCFSAALVFGLILYIFYAFMTGYLPVQIFDSGRWKQVERSNDYTRLQMIESLLLSGRLDGITRAEVITLLGPTDDTDYFADWDFVYWLGRERGLIGIDSEWLVIRIGPADKVIDYQVVRD